MAIEIDGNWDAGFSIELHTIRSTYLGVNEYGRDQFDTEYSEMGELINKLKYHPDHTDTSVTIPRIVTIINKNIKNINAVDYIIPAPPSKPRASQPVYRIVNALSENTGVPTIDNLITKRNGEQLKSIENHAEREQALRRSLQLNHQINIEGKTILLIDDVYRSGATVRAVTDLLYNQAKARRVYVLTMTKTRSRR